MGISPFSEIENQRNIMKIIVTGAAGFIGMHVSLSLMKSGHDVVGLDNLNSYYDVSLKQARLQCIESEKSGSFEFHEMALEDRSGIEQLFGSVKPDRVIHLAAQAGVRYSIENPHAYVDSNLVGFLNILEGCRRNATPHLVYASSSSVYGLNGRTPFSVSDNVDHPVSLYAATKKANELMAHSYSHLYQIPTTGLRFFTVYGPWGRPDMATMIFTRKILAGEPIQLFNHGKMKRDFTYIDDITEGVVRVMDCIPQGDKSWNSMSPNPSTSPAPYRTLNIGNNEPVELLKFVSTLELALGRKAEIEYKPMADGDVEATFADVQALTELTGFKPYTPLALGLRRFAEWYSEYYHLAN